MGSGRSTRWKPRCITTLGHCRSRNQPTNSAEEAKKIDDPSSLCLPWAGIKLDSVDVWKEHIGISRVLPNEGFCLASRHCKPHPKHIRPDETLILVGN